MFRLHADQAQAVRVLGSWDGWRQPGLELRQVAPGWWQRWLEGLRAGDYAYKYLCDGQYWLADLANAAKAGDGYGGWNSILVIPTTPAAD